MKQFAKLFESKEYGQILMVLDTGDEAQPEVRFSFMPENLGVCSVALKFEDTDAGWEEAEKAFTKFDSNEKALEAVRPTIDKMNEAYDQAV